MSDQTSMDDILAVTEPASAPDKAADEKPKVEAEAPEPEETADSSDVAETAEADKAEDKKSDTVPHEALHAEREKRRAVAAQFEELKAQNAQLLQVLSKGQDGAKPKADEKPAVSFSEDPEGFIVSSLRKIEQATRKEAANRFFDLSEANAIRRHGAEVYKDAMDWFKSEAKEKSFLIDELNKQPDPGEWLVQSHKRRSELLEVGDPNYKEKLKAQLRAEWEAEQEAAREAEEEAAEAAKPTPKPRKSLAKARSAGGRSSSKAFAGPTPIDSILPGG